MFQRRPIAGFFIKLMLVYGSLVAPWPYLDKAYVAFFRFSGNLLLNSIGPAGGVRFENGSSGDNAWMARLTLKNRRTGAEGSVEQSNVRHWYLMTALVTALIVATPVPWSRKWKSLLLGLVLANVIILLGVWLSLMGVFSGTGPLAQFSPSPWVRRALNLAVKIVAMSPETPFAVPVLIWLVVTPRRADLERWLGVSRNRQEAAEKAPRARS